MLPWSDDGGESLSLFHRELRRSGHFQQQIRRMAFPVAFALLFILTVHRTDAFKSFIKKIPNGDNVPHPCKSNTIWTGVGHLNEFGGGKRNPFGHAFKNAGFKWTKALCQEDSDKDGKTNGEELGMRNFICWVLSSWTGDGNDFLVVLTAFIDAYTIDVLQTLQGLFSIILSWSKQGIQDAYGVKAKRPQERAVFLILVSANQLIAHNAIFKHGYRVLVKNPIALEGHSQMF